jgi:hypothetical protein
VDRIAKGTRLADLLIEQSADEVIEKGWLMTATRTNATDAATELSLLVEVKQICLGSAL